MGKKINLKLAAVYSVSVLLLAGCKESRVNVISGIYENKVLLKDTTDGQERLVAFSPNFYETHLKYSNIGDEVVVPTSRSYKKNRCFIHNKDIVVFFNLDLLRQREETAQMDSLKCAIVRENQGKQR